MNSEMTRKLIERRIASNNEGIAAMDRDGISNHLQRELYDGWKQDNAIYEFALVGLSVQPRPIAECPLDDGSRYLLYSERGFERVDYWTSAWAENHLNWHTPFTHFLPPFLSPNTKGRDMTENGLANSVSSVVDRLTEYLSCGGLFNPELMDHENVQKLLYDCRETLLTYSELSPEQLAIRDAETTQRALELAADWHGEEARKQDVYQKQFDLKMDPETKLSHIRDRDKHRDHAKAILALQPAPTGWKLVPEIDYTVDDNKLAGLILTELGIAQQSASMEPSSDWKREKIAALITGELDRRRAMIWSVK